MDGLSAEISLPALFVLIFVGEVLLTEHVELVRVVRYELNDALTARLIKPAALALKAFLV